MNAKSTVVPIPAARTVRTLGHYVEGRPIAGGAGQWGSVFDPSNGATTARVPLADATETRAAIHAARAAFPAWAATPPIERARVLFRFKELLEANADQLAKLITSEHGKLLADARGEIMQGMEVVEFACGIPHLLTGEFTQTIGNQIDAWSMRVPVGVCAGITPFSLPAMVPLWMFPIAIACGNTFVLKPSEKVPSCPLRLAELLTEADLPPGVFNVINGDHVAVDTLLTDPDIAAVSFVGSTPIAEYVYKTGAAHSKRVQALGGAKNHMVVMPDADVKQAAKALMRAAFGSAGERCMAVSVAVAVGDAGDQLVPELVRLISELEVGEGTREGVDMGPLVTRDHLDRVQSYLDLGLREGAQLVVDGRESAVSGHPEGFYLGPSLFDHVRASMRIYKEEIFGPVLCVVRVADFDRALKLVNANEFGNGATLFTRDGAIARRFTHGVQSGTVGINVAIPAPMAFQSFGGWKRSLFGALNVHGQDGVRFYTRFKTVVSRL